MLMIQTGTGRRQRKGLARIEPARLRLSHGDINTDTALYGVASIILYRACTGRVLCYVTYNARKKNVCAIGTIDTTYMYMYMYDTTNSTTQ